MHYTFSTVLFNTVFSLVKILIAHYTMYSLILIDFGMKKTQQRSPNVVKKHDVTGQMTQQKS